jgi:hypothetical protein
MLSLPYIYRGFDNSKGLAREEKEVKLIVTSNSALNAILSKSVFVWFCLAMCGSFKTASKYLLGYFHVPATFLMLYRSRYLGKCPFNVCEVYAVLCA